MNIPHKNFQRRFTVEKIQFTKQQLLKLYLRGIWNALWAWPEGEHSFKYTEIRPDEPGYEKAEFTGDIIWGKLPKE